MSMRAAMSAWVAALPAPTRAKVTNHPRLAVVRRLVLGVVWDARRRVEQAVDAVATVRPVDAASIRVGDLLDGSSEVSEEAIISGDQLPLSSVCLYGKVLTFQA